MKERKTNTKLIFLCTFTVSFLTVSLATFLLTCYFSNRQFDLLGSFCGEIVREYPEGKQIVLEVLKAQSFGSAAVFHKNMLYSFGYDRMDFFRLNGKVVALAAAGFLVGIILFFCAFGYRQRKLKERIKELTLYLEKVNMGSGGIFQGGREDEFSGLQDEMYKTVTELYQTRNEALEAKKNFAENLSNIAHQLKTPITALSLSAQMLDKAGIQRQINRLNSLEEALLLLSRIDAGTLVLNRKETDIFTLLTLAFDNLQELFEERGVLADIPEAAAVGANIDLNWTMEAVINLLKNCMEHTLPGGCVHCSYEKNPLYVQIQIWNEGQGFSREDLPHLFERFYRGKTKEDGGIGIGLSLAKAIVEMQNGVIRAYNLPTWCACFEIRFYY
ncbi:MAG: HAMP domain-containing histidine kinase [Clostridium sp.]|nr:HAMP domain-containing histidine kinase [Clostridium sp.]